MPLERPGRLRSETQRFIQARSKVKEERTGEKYDNGTKPGKKERKSEKE